MKYFRIALTCLALVAALAAVLLAAAFTPFVQTWAAQAALNRHEEIRASLGSLSAGFGKVTITDLRIEARGAVLTLPSVQARVPLVDAILHGKFMVQGLEARGWTLDLGHLSGIEQAVEGAASAQAAVRIVHGILAESGVPSHLTIDGVELEGDVLAPAPEGGEPIRIHLVMKGGGLSAGHQGSFVFNTSGFALGRTFAGTPAHGRAAVGMDSTGAFNLVDVRAQFGAGSASADLSAVRGPGGETYSLEFRRGGRRALHVSGVYSDTTKSLEGQWTVDLLESDLAPFAWNRPLPPMILGARGRVFSDASFRSIRVTGNARVVARGLGVLSPRLERMGTVAMDSDFDFSLEARSLRVAGFDMALGGDHPVAVFRLLRPFAVDDAGGVTSSDPAGGLMAVSLKGVPPAWFTLPSDEVKVSGGNATGDVLVSSADGGFHLRTKTPIFARNVHLAMQGSDLARGVDLTFSLAADTALGGWDARTTSLGIDRGGRRLATIAAAVSRKPGSDEPVRITGTLDADIGAPGFARALPGAGFLPGRKVTAEVTATLGDWSEVQIKASVAGRDPGHSAAGTFGADIDANGAGTFVAPITVSVGQAASDVSADGTWSGTGPGRRIDVKFSGSDATLEHLEPLAESLAAAGGGGAEGLPFWGNWVGRAKFSFDHLRVAGREFNDADATLDVGPGAMDLLAARAWLPNHSLAKAAGSVSFDPASGIAYRVAGTASLEAVDASSMLPKPERGQEPVVEGRFGVTATVAGSGSGPGDLAGGLRAKFHIKGGTGILRLLKTNVADAIPETPARAGDSLRNVGSLVGSLFGVERHDDESGENRLAKNTEAVLDFANVIGEIGYDQLEASAALAPDGSLVFDTVAVNSPSVRLTGSGRIGFETGAPIAARPLTLEFELGARGDVARLLADAGLLSARKDGLGYAVMSGRVRLAGSLEKIDDSDWRALLVGAATRKPGGKK